MYIRRTHTNNSATGERYFTYRLVKSERVSDSTRQSTLLNLGRHFAIEQDHWPKVCARIDEIMACQLTLMLVECPLAAEREPQRIAALLLARKGVTVTVPEPVSKTANPAALELHRPRSVNSWSCGRCSN